MTKTVVLDPTTIRLLVRRGIQVRTATSLMTHKEEVEITSQRLVMGAIQVGEGASISLAASGVVPQSIR
jgi:hypothetical protein